MPYNRNMNIKVLGIYVEESTTFAVTNFPNFVNYNISIQKGFGANHTHEAPVSGTTQVRVLS